VEIQRSRIQRSESQLQLLEPVQQICSRRNQSTEATFEVTIRSINGSNQSATVQSTTVAFSSGKSGPKDQVALQ